MLILTLRKSGFTHVTWSWVDGAGSPGLLQALPKPSSHTTPQCRGCCTPTQLSPLWHWRDLPPPVWWELPHRAFFMATGQASLFLLPLKGRQTPVGEYRNRQLPAFLLACHGWLCCMGSSWLCQALPFLSLVTETHFAFLQSRAQNCFLLSMVVPTRHWEMWLRGSVSRNHNKHCLQEQESVELASCAGLLLAKAAPSTARLPNLLTAALSSPVFGFIPSWAEAGASLHSPELTATSTCTFC